MVVWYDSFSHYQNPKKQGSEKEGKMSSVTTVVEEKPITTTTTKKKTDKTGDLFVDIAHEIETLTKTKALNEAERLAENVEESYFRLGGVLKLIQDNSWFEGYKDFPTFVREKYGFGDRKARYLQDIYTALVIKQIPWEKVHHLGWTKMKDLAPVLTLENLDEWIPKADKMTVTELMEAIKGSQGQVGVGGQAEQKLSNEVVKFHFKLKKDQAEIVTQAIAKAKAEVKTEYDTVALENICAGYVGGTLGIKPAVSFEDQVKSFGMVKSLEIIADLFPKFDISVEEVKEQVAS